MLKVLKNLKKSWIDVILIVILLCLQAWADLELPSYTSKIVNVGIAGRRYKLHIYSWFTNAWNSNNKYGICNSNNAIIFKSCSKAWRNVKRKSI